MTKYRREAHTALVRMREIQHLHQEALDKYKMWSSNMHSNQDRWKGCGTEGRAYELADRIKEAQAYVTMLDVVCSELFDFPHLNYSERKAMGWIKEDPEDEPVPEFDMREGENDRWARHTGRDE